MSSSSLSQLMIGALGVWTPKLTPSFVEQTQGQVSVTHNATKSLGLNIGYTFLDNLVKEQRTNSAMFYAKVRAMRQHPTVRLTRQLLVSTMAEAPWSVKGKDNAPDGAVEFIEEQFLPHHDQLMSKSIQGTFDFGWQPWEKVFKFQSCDMSIGIAKFKPLLQDQTEIVVYSDTGAFAGLRQFQTYLNVPNVLLINRDVEGTNFYGEGAMPSIEIPFNRWLATDAANSRYDIKISGAHWVIRAPSGRSDFNGQKNVDNHVIANALLQALENSGSIIVPSDIKGFVADLNSGNVNSAWMIDLISADASAQVGFQQRLAYLDTLMVRASGFPERSILEGQYGTKAEAEAHADFSVANMDFQNKHITQQINKHSVNQMLGYNFGPDAIGTVELECAPIADDKIALLKQVYLAVIANPTAGPNELAQIDMQAMRDKVGVPTLSAEEQQANAGPDYTGGTGINGGNDPMLQQFLQHLNTPDVQANQQQSAQGQAI